MKRWIMPRGTGKTTQMIYESASTDAIIVVHNRSLVTNILRRANDLGLEIPHPITFAEFIDENVKSGENYIVDEIDCCLRSLSVTGYSYSDYD